MATIGWFLNSIMNWLYDNFSILVMVAQLQTQIFLQHERIVGQGRLKRGGDSVSKLVSILTLPHSHTWSVLWNKIENYKPLTLLSNTVIHIAHIFHIIHFMKPLHEEPLFLRVVCRLAFSCKIKSCQQHSVSFVLII